jgi:hypothetical protein
MSIDDGSPTNSGRADPTSGLKDRRLKKWADGKTAVLERRAVERQPGIPLSPVRRFPCQDVVRPGTLCRILVSDRYEMVTVQTSAPPGAAIDPE